MTEKPITRISPVNPAGRRIRKTITFEAVKYVNLPRTTSFALHSVFCYEFLPEFLNKASPKTFLHFFQMSVFKLSVKKARIF